MDIQINIKNLPELSASFDRMPKNINKALTKGIDRAALLVEREAKLAATDMIYNRPTGKSGYARTGLLRNRIEITSQSALLAIVKSNVKYAYYVHEGKGGNISYGRRPYMEKGAKNADVGKVIAGELENALKL